MRVSREEMEKSHRRIVQGASRLVRERGIESTGVADVMKGAGLTNGGFYRHFDSKDALVEAAIQSAFDEVASFVEARMREREPAVVMERYRDYYLSPGHVDHPGSGCPVAALSGDLARAEQQLKGTFGAGVQRMIRAISGGKDGTEQDKRASAIREFAMLVGAVMIARASDPETAREVLAACREAPNT